MIDWPDLVRPRGWSCQISPSPGKLLYIIFRVFPYYILGIFPVIFSVTYDPVDEQSWNNCFNVTTNVR